jgi:Kef-type K+ transport system membrane component KefB
MAVLITLLAMATKIVGCGLGARKLGPKSAAIVGVGMMPRGEVGIIVASIGLSMAAIPSGTFAIVVFMAIATTIAAPPLLAWTFKRKIGLKG